MEKLPTIPNNTNRKTNKMAKLVVSTEKWNTKNGQVLKAVVRTMDGKFIGATNQTKAVPLKAKAKRASRSNFTIMGK